MRGTSRLLANVKSAARYLEPNAPTGLTGVPNHPSPRPALIYTYRTTLNKLKQLPGSSVYRQSTEALTNHRLKIIEETVPEGYEEWRQRVQGLIDAKAGEYQKYLGSDGSLKWDKIQEENVGPWDGRVKRGSAFSEGVNTMAEAEEKAKAIQDEIDEVEVAEKRGTDDVDPSDLPVEPQLTVEQINSIETKIGMGLIEEVLLVAEGELKLIDEMLSSQAWEPLEEQAPSDQWKYFDRGDVV